MKMEDLVRAAQEYDWQNRPRDGSWTRVKDSQVARLLLGAKLAINADVSRGGYSRPERA
jgi:hypothetical protein